jgi:hypothetical protein
MEVRMRCLLLRCVRQLSAAGLIIAATMATTAVTSAQQPSSIQDRARGAARVVVASVVETTSRYERNEFGDQLIITDARLVVEEALKGTDDAIVLELEGGTVDGITMRVSDLPPISKGERAVFFLKSGRNGVYEPHLRGQGILKLDERDYVRGTSLSLSEVRRLAKEAR